MKKTKIFAFLIFSLFIFVFAAPLEDAQALKSKGNPVRQFGSATKAIVCGDKLCSEISEKFPKEMTPTEPKLLGIPVAPEIDPQKGYFVEEIKDGLYWLTDGIYQIMFLTTGQGVIAIDAPPSIGEKYLKAIAEVSNELVTHVIYSHSHRDHIGAASIFPNDVQIIAHHATAESLKRSDDPNRSIPTVTFEDDYVLQVGDQQLELSYFGPAHVAGNIFIYAPSQKFLMAVDIIKPGWAPFKTAFDGEIHYFIEAHKKILQYDFELFSSGHVNRLGTIEDVKTALQYIDDLKDSASLALQKVDFVSIAKQIGPSQPWHLVNAYYDELSQTCAADFVPKWQGKLNEVEVFAGDHCSSMIKHLRLD